MLGGNKIKADSVQFSWAWAEPGNISEMDECYFCHDSINKDTTV